MFDPELQEAYEKAKNEFLKWLDEDFQSRDRFPSLMAFLQRFSDPEWRTSGNDAHVDYPNRDSATIIYIPDDPSGPTYVWDYFDENNNTVQCGGDSTLSDAKHHCDTLYEVRK